MKIITTSRMVLEATSTVFRLMPQNENETVQRFVSVLRASNGYSCGLCDVDQASAMLAPIYRFERDGYDAQVHVTLPIFRLFSAKAQIGIIAHEFAHAVRASRMGDDWHDKMRARYGVEEGLADRIARGWGFGKYIDARCRERDKTVNPLIEAREPGILRRINERVRRQQQENLRRHSELAQELKREGRVLA